ncbi:MAG: ASCH domain-containing protein [Eubacterium sp.]
MKHYFNLKDSPFEKIANGTKTIELRLYDEKRQKINVGDEIVFFNSKGNTLPAIVTALHRFYSFRELYNNLDLLKCGYDKSNITNASYTDMEEYYSADDIKKYGVVGIEINRK